jgi:hypothetical protein
MNTTTGIELGFATDGLLTEGELDAVAGGGLLGKAVLLAVEVAGAVVGAYLHGLWHKGE